MQVVRRRRRRRRSHPAGHFQAVGEMRGCLIKGSFPIRINEDTAPRRGDTVNNQRVLSAGVGMHQDTIRIARRA